MKNYVLVLILFSSCDMSKKYSDSDIERILNEKYGKRFTVESNKFNFETNESQFIAYPVNNPQIKVNGSYHDNESEIKDNYRQKLHCYEAEVFLTQFLNPFYEKCAVKANVMSPLQRTSTHMVRKLLP